MFSCPLNFPFKFRLRSLHLFFSCSLFHFLLMFFQFTIHTNPDCSGFLMRSCFSENLFLYIENPAFFKTNRAFFTWRRRWHDMVSYTGPFCYLLVSCGSLPTPMLPLSHSLKCSPSSLVLRSRCCSVSVSLSQQQNKTPQLINNNMRSKLKINNAVVYWSGVLFAFSCARFLSLSWFCIVFLLYLFGLMEFGMVVLFERGARPQTS